VFKNNENDEDDLA